MRANAGALQALYPSVVYISGRRNAAAQANAMAGNHLQDPHALAATYKNGAVFLAAIERLPKSAQGKRTHIAQAIEGLLISQPHLLEWKHKDGNAVDLQPMEDAMAQPTALGRLVLTWIRECPETVYFTTREGGLVRWHWETRKSERSENI